MIDKLKTTAAVSQYEGARRLVWLRNDLRLADNPALYEACRAGGEVVVLFVLCPEQHRVHGEAAVKYDFYCDHIADFRRRLERLGICCLVKVVPYFADVAMLFEQLVAELAVDAVYFNRCYWPNEQRRDAAVVEVLKRRAVKVLSFDGHYLLPPGSVTKQDGSMYNVFTPYKKKFIEQLKERYRPPLPMAKDEPAESAKVDVKQRLSWEVGELAAHQQAQAFCADNHYAVQRDYPAQSGTSRLSPYLFVGAISAKQCLSYALSQDGEAAFSGQWVSELIWREFYNDLMFHYPKLARQQPFKSQATDHWLSHAKLLAAWQSGKTGFPIIDAGMRQLEQEAWLHNRLRMLTASFLCKLCLIDWRLGEAYFMSKLIDGDLASNNGGWQWSSSTGCDAAPYFRIFNPTAQSKKFDPDGAYIRKYLPELKSLSNREIHNPSREQRLTCNYPQPIIDYKTARAAALVWFTTN